MLYFEDEIDLMKLNRGQFNMCWKCRDDIVERRVVKLSGATGSSGGD